MEEKRLIDADEARRRIIAFATGLHSEVLPVDTVVMLLIQMPPVDAVEVVHPEVRNAVTLLQKQYEKALNSPYVRDPLAWALYHTWKMLDNGKRKDGDGNG